MAAGFRGVRQQIRTGALLIINNCVLGFFSI